MITTEPLLRDEQLSGFPDSEPASIRPMVGDHAEVIRRFVQICERAAGGDLEARITGVDADTDLGRLARAINHLLDMSDAFVREAAAAMENCSHDRFHRPILLRGMHGAYRQSAQIINRAGLKMRESSEQINFAARLANETASSVSTVAAACEELNSTSSEISKRAGDSASLTREAVSVVDEANQAVDQLSEAGRKVNSIVALISKIAGQTNLLALNATIEAARAGEAGRGFAVVATEVKELSRSTAKATDEITEQVERMHSTVTAVAAQIKSIHTTVGKVSESADAISHSVSEQVTATADIARNLATVSKNSELVSQRIGSVTVR